MNKLFVITFKRPALDIEKLTMNIDFAYDCEATGIPEVAEIRHKDALNKYEDVKMFECEDYEYVEFVKNDDAYIHFVRTGEHSMKPIESFEEECKSQDGTHPEAVSEDVEVGTDSHTETIQLELTMEKHTAESTFEYTVDIDDVGQIIITPIDTSVSFIDIRKLIPGEVVTETADETTKKFQLNLTANMISENNNFEFFCDIDEVGQAILTPDEESTSFLTVSVDNSLNLVTECNESLSLNEDIDPTTEEYETKKEICLEVIDDLENLLNDAIEKCKALERYFREIGIHGADIQPYMINYLEDFIEGSRDVSCSQFRERIDEYEDNFTTNESLDESVTDDKKMEIINRFMQGTISMFSDDGEPDQNYIHISELDSVQGKIVYEYYYDEESDAMVSYTREAK